jgi:hypothetical protein
LTFEHPLNHCRVFVFDGNTVVAPIRHVRSLIKKTADEYCYRKHQDHYLDTAEQDISDEVSH